MEVVYSKLMTRSSIRNPNCAKFSSSGSKRPVSAPTATRRSSSTICRRTTPITSTWS
ncbi:MAG: hypothetical protein ACLSVD_01940 [Eggerthellaceae bacterium]